MGLRLACRIRRQPRWRMLSRNRFSRKLNPAWATCFHGRAGRTFESLRLEPRWLEHRSKMSIRTLAKIWGMVAPLPYDGIFVDAYLPAWRPAYHNANAYTATRDVDPATDFENAVAAAEATGEETRHSGWRRTDRFRRMTPGRFYALRTRQFAIRRNTGR